MIKICFQIVKYIHVFIFLFLITIFLQTWKRTWSKGELQKDFGDDKILMAMTVKPTLVTIDKIIHDYFRLNFGMLHKKVNACIEWFHKFIEVFKYRTVCVKSSSLHFSFGVDKILTLEPRKFQKISAQYIKAHRRKFWKLYFQYSKIQKGQNSYKN